MMAENDILARAKKRFEDASSAHSHNREQALDDLRFARLGEQWPDWAEKQRKLQGRPMLTYNKLPSYIRQVVNDCRQNRPSIKVHPVDDTADVQTAFAINGIVRAIERNSRAAIAYDTAVDFAASCGFGYIRVETDYAYDDSFDMDIFIRRVANPFTVFEDPNSVEPDSSDWKFCFVTEFLSEDDFEKKYPGAEKSSFQIDKDDELWRDGDKIRVAEYWEKEEISEPVERMSDGSILRTEELDEDVGEDMEAGNVGVKLRDVLAIAGIVSVGKRDSYKCKVTRHIMTGAGIIKSDEWPGRYIPVVPVYGEEMNVEGKRYYRSMIYAARDAQTSYNFFRTNAAEYAATQTKAPWIGPVGAFKTDKSKWATANAQNHAYIEYDGQVQPQRISPPTSDAAAMAESMASADDIKSVLGMFDPSMGQQSDDPSGRALLLRQKKGDLNNFHIADNLARAIEHVGRIVVDLIPHVYSGPRVMKVIGIDGAESAVPVNQQFMDDDGQPTQINLAAGRYDVSVEVGPSYGTKREEAAYSMLEFMRVNPQQSSLFADLVAKNMDWPESQEISARLKAMLPPQLQGQNPEAEALKQQLQQLQHALQQMMQQNQALQQQMANVMTDAQSKILKVQADAAGKERDRIIDAFNAETNRIKATQSGMTPEQVAAIATQAAVQTINSPDILAPNPALPVNGQMQ